MFVRDLDSMHTVVCSLKYIEKTNDRHAQACCIFAQVSFQAIGFVCVSLALFMVLLLKDFYTVHAE